MDYCLASIHITGSRRGSILYCSNHNYDSMMLCTTELTAKVSNDRTVNPIQDNQYKLLAAWPDAPVHQTGTSLLGPYICVICKMCGNSYYALTHCGHCDAIWWHRSSLAQVIACYTTWLHQAITQNKFDLPSVWSTDNHLWGISQKLQSVAKTSLINTYLSKILLKSPRCKWVNLLKGVVMKFCL